MSKNADSPAPAKHSEGDCLRVSGKSVEKTAEAEWLGLSGAIPLGRLCWLGLPSSALCYSLVIDLPPGRSSLTPRPTKESAPP